MRFMNHAGRLTLLVGDALGADVQRASGGRLPASPPDALERWAEVVAWAESHDGEGDVQIVTEAIGPPSPAPRQIFGIGLNYATHAEEAGLAVPSHPLIFTKLHAAIAGPYDDIPISTAAVDWEVELTVVIGAYARHVGAADAWKHVAGFTGGQDLSEREVQFRPAGLPQFTLGKSLPRFGPTGPMLATLDEFEDPEDVELSCTLNGVEVQRGRTSDFIFTIPQLIEYLSAQTMLHPGDLIMTGTPSGVGTARTPPVYLKPGDVLETNVAGVGVMRHTFVEDPDAPAPAATDEASVAGER